MTSKNATYQHSLILSIVDEKVNQCKYSIGDKFTVDLEDKSFSNEIKELLRGYKPIIEIVGFALTASGEVVYDTKIIHPENEQTDFHWLTSDKDLESGFIYLGSNYHSLRGFMIDV